MHEIGIYFTVARPGRGKSVDNARITRALLFGEYPARRRKYPELKERYILNNNELALDLKKRLQKPEDFIFYRSGYDLKFCHRKNCWIKDDEEFGGHPIHDCDVFIDEIANFCPAENWATTPLWMRDIFSQHRKLGLRIFANSQDYNGVDINFRRMVKHAYFVDIMFKSRDLSASLPPPRWIHGLVVKREIPVEQLEELGATSERLEEKLSMWGWPADWYFLTRRLVSSFDSYYRVPRWRSVLMEEIIQTCVRGEKCASPRDHVKVFHRPI